MPQSGSKSVTLPVALLERIRRLVEANPERWANVTHFVRAAVIRALRDEEKK